MVAALFVVSSFCTLCLVYLLSVEGLVNSCCLEQCVNNLVYSCYGCYPYVPILGDVVLEKSDALYILYSVEKKQVLPWVASVGDSYFFLSFLLSSPVTRATSLFLSISSNFPGIKEGTGDQCDAVRNCTWHLSLAHLFTIHFLGPLPILLSLSSSFPGTEEVHADSNWQIAKQA